MYTILQEILKTHYDRGRYTWTLTKFLFALLPRLETTTVRTNPNANPIPNSNLIPNLNRNPIHNEGQKSEHLNTFMTILTSR